MKNTFLGALLLVALLACTQNADGDLTASAEQAIVKLEEATALIESIKTPDDAAAIEADLSALGKDYAELMTAISAVDQTDQETAVQLASLMPKVASAYQALIASVNELHGRNTNAAQIIMDDLKAFQQ